MNKKTDDDKYMRLQGEIEDRVKTGIKQEYKVEDWSWTDALQEFGRA